MWIVFKVEFYDFNPWSTECLNFISVLSRPGGKQPLSAVQTGKEHSHGNGCTFPGGLVGGPHVYLHEPCVTHMPLLVPLPNLSKPFQLSDDLIQKPKWNTDTFFPL